MSGSPDENEFTCPHLPQTGRRAESPWPPPVVPVAFPRKPSQQEACQGGGVICVAWLVKEAGVLVVTRGDRGGGRLRARRDGRAGPGPAGLPTCLCVVRSRVAVSCRAVRLYVASTGFPLVPRRGPGPDSAQSSSVHGAAGLPMVSVELRGSGFVTGSSRRREESLRAAQAARGAVISCGRRGGPGRAPGRDLAGGDASQAWPVATDDRGIGSAGFRLCSALARTRM